MTSWDVGYLAASLVLVAFGMKEMVPLRIIALCSNLAFIVYGIALGLAPIWLLHASLLPLNGWRLGQELRSSARTGRTGAGKSRMRWRKVRRFVMAWRRIRRRRTVNVARMSRPGRDRGGAAPLTVTLRSGGLITD